jgi:hypothetical protein
MGSCVLFHTKVSCSNAGGAQFIFDWLIDWLNTCIAHISILSNAQGAWPMFWLVLIRCHILRWDWSLLPLARHSHFAFWELSCVRFSECSTILWLSHRDCRILVVRAWCSECVHTVDLGFLFFFFTFYKCSFIPLTLNSELWTMYASNKAVSLVNSGNRAFKYKPKNPKRE